MSQHPTSSFAVMQALAERLHPSQALVRTSFGVLLAPRHGRFVVGQRVLAPGLDDCTPCRISEVLAVGVRNDHPGCWYWVRERGLGRGESLVEEQALRPLGIAAPQRVATQQEAARTGVAREWRLASFRVKPARHA